MIQKIFVALFIAAVLTAPKANAKALSELALFQRCYVHLTGHPVPLNDPRIGQIKAGALTSLNACYSLIDNVKLQDNGRPKVESVESREVLKQFFNLHRSWFPANTQEQASGYSADFFRTTVDMYDMNEPALAVTYFALRDSAKYSDLMKGTGSVEALREEDAAVRARIGWAVSNPSRYLAGNNGYWATTTFAFRMPAPAWQIFAMQNDGSSTGFNEPLLNINPPQIGELVGIRPNTRSLVSPNLTLDPATNPGTDRRGDQLPLEQNRNIFDSFGGGVIGSPEYFMLNAGHPTGTLFNGTTKLPRRWAQAIQGTFLCIDVTQRKALREQDIGDYLITQSNVSADELKQYSSVAPFRQSKSCLQCHSSYDPMASTARNLVLGISDYQQVLKSPADQNLFYKNTIVIGKLTQDPSVTLPHEWLTVPIDNDPRNPRFGRTAPVGHLRYRSSAGDFIDIPVNDMEGLGQAISNQDDYYRCAAKHYFQYFTGFNINLFDRKDPANASLNTLMDDEAIAHRALIDQMAAELKSTQSITNMMKVILRSSTYRDSNYSGVQQ